MQLREFEGKSYKEIASIMAISEEQLKFYESPAAEVVEMEVEVSLLAGSGGDGLPGGGSDLDDDDYE
jgi:hypothetical protein